MRNARGQLDLRLRYCGWGGRREGAGRKPGPNPCIPHLRRETFAERHPVHVTLKVRKGIPSLRVMRLVRELERSFADACERRDFRLVDYSIQRDHAHLIVEARGPEALGRGMKSIGTRFARTVNRVFKRRGAVLADRYHMRPLRTPREVRAALRYVLLNAGKHGRKLKERIDRASSGRWFDGWRGSPRPSAEPRSVALSRSWLLSRGWRRHGLLDPGEVPGPG